MQSMASATDSARALGLNGGSAARATLGSIMQLLQVSEAEGLAKSAPQLDAALSLLCAQLDPADKSLAHADLVPLAHLFPRSIERLAEQNQSTAQAGFGIDVETLRFASMEHLLRAADEPDLDEQQTAILIFRGNGDVLARVTANPSARFARSSLTTLIELAPGDRRIKENLINRPDMPEPLSMRLLPFLNLEQKVRLFVAGASIDTATAANDLAIEREVYNGSGVDPSRDIDDTIVRLCEDARISEISEVVADRLRIPLACSMNLLCGRMDHAAALALFAAGASARIVLPMLNLRQRLECRHSKDMRGAHDAFARYTREVARDIVSRCAGDMQASGLVLPEFSFETPDAAS